MADAAAVPHEVHVHGVHLLRIVRPGELGEQRVRLVGGDLLVDDAEPPRDAVHVGVDRHHRPAEREQQHAGGRLGPDAGQRHEVVLRLLVGHPVELAQVGRARPLADRLEDLLDARRLGVGEAAEGDGLLDLLGRRVAGRGPLREPRLERRERALRVHVGGVLAEHGEDELVDRRVARREHGAAVEVVQQVGRLPEPLLG